MWGTCAPFFSVEGGRLSNMRRLVNSVRQRRKSLTESPLNLVSSCHSFSASAPPKDAPVLDGAKSPIKDTKTTKNSLILEVTMQAKRRVC